MTETQWNLIDDMLSDFRIFNEEGKSDCWYNVCPDTQAALRAMWDECERLKEQIEQLKVLKADALELAAYRRLRVAGGVSSD